MVTWNTGEETKLYKQNYIPTHREKAEAKQCMIKDMCDIILPEFVEHVSDLIIVCTQEMSVTKNKQVLIPGI